MEDTQKSAKRAMPRWVTLALIVAWVLFGCAAIAVILWQFLPERPSPNDPERSRTFLLGEVVDLSDDAYSYEEMKADLSELCRLYPDRVRMASAGSSVDGRDILYADLGASDAERSIFISAGIHGREDVTPLIAMKLLEYYLVNYDTENENGVAFSDVASDCLFRVVPMVNPDGIALAQEGLSAIRDESLRESVEAIYENDCLKYDSYAETYEGMEDYLRYWKANLHGVDLNRNFPIDRWEEISTGIPQPSSQKYKGGEPASEPETRAVMNLLQEMEGTACVISLHSQGEILYWNCGQTGEHHRENKQLAQDIARLTGYRPVDTFTAPDGTLDDWAALNLKVPSVNIEMGKGSVLLPTEQNVPIWEKIKGLWQLLAER